MLCFLSTICSCRVHDPRAQPSWNLSHMFLREFLCLLARRLFQSFHLWKNWATWNVALFTQAREPTSSTWRSFNAGCNSIALCSCTWQCCSISRTCCSQSRCEHSKRPWTKCLPYLQRNHAWWNFELHQCNPRQSRARSQVEFSHN